MVLELTVGGESVAAVLDVGPPAAGPAAPAAPADPAEAESGAGGSAGDGDAASEAVEEPPPKRPLRDFKADYDAARRVKTDWFQGRDWLGDGGTGDVSCHACGWAKKKLVTIQPRLSSIKSHGSADVRDFLGMRVSVARLGGHSFFQVACTTCIWRCRRLTCC